MAWRIAPPMVHQRRRAEEAAPAHAAVWRLRKNARGRRWKLDAPKRLGVTALRIKLKYIFPEICQFSRNAVAWYAGCASASGLGCRRPPIGGGRWHEYVAK